MLYYQLSCLLETENKNVNICNTLNSPPRFCESPSDKSSWHWWLRGGRRKYLRLLQYSVQYSPSYPILRRMRKNRRFGSILIKNYSLNVGAREVIGKIFKSKLKKTWLKMHFKHNLFFIFFYFLKVWNFPLLFLTGSLPCIAHCKQRQLDH